MILNINMGKEKIYIFNEYDIFEKWFFIFGLCIGLFGTYFIVHHLYCYTGCFCIFNIHIHHLYIGFIINIIFLILWRKNRNSERFLNLIYIFFMGFGLGMMIDDILSHFIIRDDPFEWLCGEFCHC